MMRFHISVRNPCAFNQVQIFERYKNKKFVQMQEMPVADHMRPNMIRGHHEQYHTSTVCSIRT